MKGFIKVVSIDPGDAESGLKVEVNLESVTNMDKSCILYAVANALGLDERGACGLLALHKLAIDTQEFDDK